MKNKTHSITRRKFLSLSGTMAVGTTLLSSRLLTSVSKGAPMISEISPESLFKNQLGINSNLINKILGIALSKGGEYADFYAEYRIDNMLRLEEHILKDASKNISLGVGIRVLKGDQTGYAYAEDITFENLKKAAMTAAVIANNNKKVSEINVTPIPISSFYPIELPIQSREVTDKIKLIQEAEAKVFNLDKRITKSTVYFSDSERSILVANSDNRLLIDSQPMMRFGVTAIAEENGQIQSGYQSGGGRKGMEYFSKIKSHTQIAEEAVQDALDMLKAKDAPAGLMPIVLGAGDSGILLHESIGHPLEADFNRKGTSAYAGRIGQKVASELCTIYDGGTIPNDRGSINFDDETILASKTLLIEKGILRGYMHDRISASFYKVNPTGNGRRESYKHYPMPRMTVTYLDNGSSSPDDIIKSVKKGIYCRSFSGGQVDISNGDFVFSPTIAYMIEDGKITYPVKNFTLIGNGPDVLTKVTMIGNDFAFSDGKWTCGKGQSVPVGVGLPTILVSEITVGGKKS